MQFAYQFPELIERLVLVASGGLGPEVSLALRAATLPGTPLVLRIATATTPRWLLRLGLAVVRAVRGRQDPRSTGSPTPSLPSPTTEPRARSPTPSAAQ